jgi:DNA repair exonuclease SbcCD ATPase subunit
VLKLEASVQHNKLFSNGLLAALILVAMLVLYMHYRRVTYRIQQEEQQKLREMSRLRELEDQSTRRLRGLSAEHEELTTELNRLKATLEDQKSAASRNEDELFDEIESLEDKLNANLALQAGQQQEIDRLTEQLRNQKSEKEIDDKKKMKASQAVGKRFSTIYKNITIGSRALDGFVELNEDLKIKAEELVHQLNHDPGQVVIKRKVFIGKRDKKNIKEVIFGYKGRLYFRNLKDGGIEVLAIGTKNTQAREMEYLNRL